MRISEKYADTIRGPAPLRGADRSGERFGKLTILCASTIRAKNGNVKWVCRCDCGNFALVLMTGKTRSCGCLMNASRAKLTPEQREAVRADKRTLREIAADYGCSQPTIWKAKQ